tara:strand:- start:338 stop:445 length:108 start_codon:yes stop_codon:yes gene_type:complete
MINNKLGANISKADIGIIAIKLVVKISANSNDGVD